MNDIRKMTFGKYKGQPILLVIAEHIGYVMWCFENISWFSLNEEEQKFYDWEAIAIKKYDMPMTFPVETMYKHIKDREAFERLDTPYQFIGRDSFIPDTELSPLLIKAGVIWRGNANPSDQSYSDNRSWWCGLQHTTNKIIESMSEDEIEEMLSYGVTPPIHPIY